MYRIDLLRTVHTIFTTPESHLRPRTIKGNTLSLQDATFALITYIEHEMLLFNFYRFVSLKTIASLRTHSRDHDKGGTCDYGVNHCRRCRGPSLLNVLVIWASMGVQQGTYHHYSCTRLRHHTSQGDFRICRSDETAAR